MVGKWHLMKNSEPDERCQDMGSTPATSAVYDHCIDNIKSKGFTSVGAWYHGNIATSNNQFFSHNPEWMVHEAQRMINEAVNVAKPFYIHFSFTLTHSPSPLDALSLFSNLDTPKGTLTGNER